MLSFSQSTCGVLFCLLLSCFAWAPALPAAAYPKIKRTITPDNTCGGANGYTCDPNAPQGGSCCSASGYCGYTAAYCGTGCQSRYGSCFGASAPATQSGNLWLVAGLGAFTTAKTYTFTGTTLPAGLAASSYTVHDAAPAPYSHIFLPADVSVAAGYLQLKVPGGQTASPLQSAEVTTTAANILYGSVRTTAILGAAAGTCNGMFFYKSDSQEMDIEYLSDPRSTSNPGDGSKPLQYTNQAVDGVNGHKTHTTAPSPADAASAAHEYRVDWVKGKTLYYLDGVLQQSFTTNVPSIPGTWIWNNWANGDPGWTGAPPATDNVFKISKVVMYYNTSGT
ncbi:MAG: hypothetical protein M1826_006476 [Phylliscum demangeonii]|nr:MAG: hypothetical protein M1826_006476 [Phylliscum demangeonii]